MWRGDSRGSIIAKDLPTFLWKALINIKSTWTTEHPCENHSYSVGRRCFYWCFAIAILSDPFFRFWNKSFTVCSSLVPPNRWKILLLLLLIITIVQYTAAVVVFSSLLGLLLFYYILILRILVDRWLCIIFDIIYFLSINSLSTGSGSIRFPNKT